MIAKINSVNIYPQKNLGISFKSSISNESQTDVVQQKQAPVPVPTLIAYMSNMSYPSNTGVEFFNTISVDEMAKKYSDIAKSTTLDLKTRAGQTGQVLNWIGVLPETQIKRLDEIYSLADSLKQKGGGKLAVIGIGGSKHTVENLLSLYGHKDKACFLSAADPDSIKEFVENNIKEKDKAAVLVASKSGTTLEPAYDFESVQKLFPQNFDNYVCITDKDSNKSKLRKIAESKGYKCGIIHDDCGGRFGAFDDHTLVALAYCGLPKDDMKRMLEASLNAQKKFLNHDIRKNLALQRALFNVESVLSGKQNQYDYYFGDRFDGTTLWNTQLKKESLKSLYKMSGDILGPAFLHNSTEADLDENNKDSFYTFNVVKNDKSEQYKLYNALVDGSLKAYSQRHPLSKITLKDFSPESVAEFIEMKHFETIYTGMILRQLKNNSGNNEQNNSVLPEVLQPHVDIYKTEVNKLLKN